MNQKMVQLKASFILKLAFFGLIDKILVKTLLSFIGKALR
jgi:hypothetical protein